MNAQRERFNRIVQEECIDYDLLFLDDLTDFNLKLLRYLSWYSLERPHLSLAWATFHTAKHPADYL